MACIKLTSQQLPVFATATGRDQLCTRDAAMTPLCADCFVARARASHRPNYDPIPYLYGFTRHLSPNYPLQHVRTGPDTFERGEPPPGAFRPGGPPGGPFREPPAGRMPAPMPGPGPGPRGSGGDRGGPFLDPGGFDQPGFRPAGPGARPGSRPVLDGPPGYDLGPRGGAGPDPLFRPPLRGGPPGALLCPSACMVAWICRMSMRVSVRLTPHGLPARSDTHMGLWVSDALRTSLHVFARLCTSLHARLAGALRETHTTGAN